MAAETPQRQHSTPTSPNSFLLEARLTLLAASIKAQIEKLTKSMTEAYELHAEFKDMIDLAYCVEGGYMYGEEDIKSFSEDPSIWDDKSGLQSYKIKWSHGVVEQEDIIRSLDAERVRLVGLLKRISPSEAKPFKYIEDGDLNKFPDVTPDCINPSLYILPTP